MRYNYSKIILIGIVFSFFLFFSEQRYSRTFHAEEESGGSGVILARVLEVRLSEVVVFILSSSATQTQ